MPIVDDPKIHESDFLEFLKEAAGNIGETYKNQVIDAKTATAVPAEQLPLRQYILKARQTSTSLLTHRFLTSDYAPPYHLWQSGNLLQGVDPDSDLASQWATSTQRDMSEEELSVTLSNGESYNLSDFAANFERCRQLVNGMRVKAILVSDEVFNGIVTLVPRYVRKELATMGFDKGFAGHVEWRGIIVRDVTHYAPGYHELDISAVPFIYRNQEGVDMSIQPPWAPATGNMERRGEAKQEEVRKRGARKVILEQEDE